MDYRYTTVPTPEALEFFQGEEVMFQGLKLKVGDDGTSQLRVPKRRAESEPMIAALLATALDTGPAPADAQLPSELEQELTEAHTKIAELSQQLADAQAKGGQPYPGRLHDHNADPDLKARGFAKNEPDGVFDREDIQKRQSWVMGQIDREWSRQRVDARARVQPAMAWGKYPDLPDAPAQRH